MLSSLLSSVYYVACSAINHVSVESSIPTMIHDKLSSLPESMVLTRVSTIIIANAWKTLRSASLCLGASVLCASLLEILMKIRFELLQMFALLNEFLGLVNTWETRRVVTLKKDVKP